jgi:hypothetical protein
MIKYAKRETKAKTPDGMKKNKLLNEEKMEKSFKTMKIKE